MRHGRPQRPAAGRRLLRLGRRVVRLWLWLRLRLRLACYGHEVTQRPHIALAIIALALGAALNLAVAWGFALWRQPNWADQEPVEIDPSPLIAQYGPSDGSIESASLKDAASQLHGRGAHAAEPLRSRVTAPSIAASSSRRAFGVSINGVRAEDRSALPIESGVIVVEWRFGWPAKTFRCGMWADLTRNLPNVHDAWIVPRDIGWLGIGAGRAVPHGFLWCGAVLNSLLYAACLWIVIQSARQFRRCIRRRQSRCTHCGYDLRGSLPHPARCPECGVHALRARTPPHPQEVASFSLAPGPDRSA